MLSLTAQRMGLPVVRRTHSVCRRTFCKEAEPALFKEKPKKPVEAAEATPQAAAPAPPPAPTPAPSPPATAPKPKGMGFGSYLFIAACGFAGYAVQKPESIPKEIQDIMPSQLKDALGLKAESAASADSKSEESAAAPEAKAAPSPASTPATPTPVTAKADPAPSSSEMKGMADRLSGLQSRLDALRKKEKEMNLETATKADVVAEKKRIKELLKSGM